MDENEIIKKLDQIARMLQELPQVMAATNTLGFVGAGNTDDLKYMKAAGDW